MADYRVLLVEDDISLSKGLQFALEKQGYTVDPEFTIESSRASFIKNKYDLIILDIGLPDGSGFDFCREIRKKSKIPVIFLTACDEEVNVVMGLDIGGDDYITKPFRVNELVSRINAVMRRNNNDKEWSKLIYSGDFTLDQESCRVMKGDNVLVLTVTEYKLLKILIINKTSAVTREKLIEQLWDSDGHFVDSNTLSVYIRRLREKIEKDPQKPKHIQTLRGIGYRWQ